MLSHILPVCLPLNVCPLGLTLVSQIFRHGVLPTNWLSYNTKKPLLSSEALFFHIHVHTERVSSPQQNFMAQSNVYYSLSPSLHRIRLLSITLFYQGMRSLPLAKSLSPFSHPLSIFFSLAKMLHSYLFSTTTTLSPAPLFSHLVTVISLN